MSDITQQTFKITCEGTFDVSIDELRELHHYKERTTQDYEKFKNSINRLGFSFPFFVWEDKEGTKWIIDAHGRKQFLSQMRTEGYFVPNLPAVRIYADNKTQAKEKILAQESQYGKITEEGLYEFMNDQEAEVSDELDFVAFPEWIMEYEQDEIITEETHKESKKCNECHLFHKNNHSI